MALNPQSIIDDVQIDLQDTAGATWDDADMVRYINQALRQLALARPDAFSETKVVTLAAGTKQAVPAGDYMLLDCVRNMGADGATPGYPITWASREDLDAFRTWHKGSGKSYVEHYHYDPKVDRLVYYVYPFKKSTSTVQIEIVVSASYTKVTTANQATDLDHPLDDRYEQPIKDWMMRCAYLKETSVASTQKAKEFQMSFYTALGLKSKIDSVAEGTMEENK
jgi:hypothetical protein